MMMISRKLKTFHAPAERLDSEGITNQMKNFNVTESYIKALDSMNIFVIILNSYRQIVYANKAYLRIMKIGNLAEVLGKRLGESINCINAFKNETS